MFCRNFMKLVHWCILFHEPKLYRFISNFTTDQHVHTFHLVFLFIIGKGCAGCQFCGGRVVQHEAETRGDHRGEKPYQCKHCPKKFSLKHQLDTHHRVHTGKSKKRWIVCNIHCATQYAAKERKQFNMEPIGWKVKPTHNKNVFGLSLFQVLPQ